MQLKNETYGVCAESGFILDLRHILAANENRPSRGLIERTEDIEERTFSAATRSHDRQKFSMLDP